MTYYSVITGSCASAIARRRVCEDQSGSVGIPGAASGRRGGNASSYNGAICSNFPSFNISYVI